MARYGHGCLDILCATATAVWYACLPRRRGEVVGAVSAAAEAAAGVDPGGPKGPQGPQGLDASWLILQRLDDLRRGQDELRADMKALDAKFDAKIDALDAKLDAKLDALDTKLDAKVGTLDAKMERHYTTLDGKIDRLRTDQRWFIGVMCVLIIGLLAKLLIPGA